MKNYHVIRVEYFRATNSRGSRVRLQSKRFNQTVFIPFNYSLNDIREMAEKYLTAKGFEIIGGGDNEIISTTFEAIK